MQAGALTKAPVPAQLCRCGSLGVPCLLRRTCRLGVARLVRTDRSRLALVYPLQCPCTLGALRRAAQTHDSVPRWTADLIRHSSRARRIARTEVPVDIPERNDHSSPPGLLDSGIPVQVAGPAAGTALASRRTVAHTSQVKCAAFNECAKCTRPSTGRGMPAAPFGSAMAADNPSCRGSPTATTAGYVVYGATFTMRTASSLSAICRNTKPLTAAPCS
jgi:hypothetical protein